MKLSSSYAALHNVASLSQPIDKSNPLASLAQTQLQQYERVKSFIENNALDLMKGSTTIPDSLLQNATSPGAPTSGAAEGPPASGTTASTAVADLSRATAAGTSLPAAPPVAVSQAVNPAQGCAVSAAHPSIDQPKVGDKKLTGRLRLDGEKVPDGTTVYIQVKTSPVGSPEWGPEGAFTKETELSQGDTVQVTQLPCATGGTVTASVLPSTCDKSKPPCLSQPYDGDTQIRGMASTGATVSVKVNEQSVGSATVSADGTFSKEDLTSPLSLYDKVQVDQTMVGGVTSGTGQVPVIANQSVTAQDVGRNTLFTRSTLGAAVGAASGATPSARLFLDFYVTGPLFGGSNNSQTKQANLKHQFKDPLDTRVWAFFNPRLTSVSQSNIAVGSLAPSNPTIFQSAGTTDLTKLVQSLEMQQGLEVRLFNFKRWMPDTIGEIPRGGGSGSRLGLFAYGSYGVGVPITGQQNVNTVYVGNAALDALYGAPSGTQYIAVVENSKNRFYRDFYLGLHLKTFNYDVKPCKVQPPVTSGPNTTTPAPSFCPLVRNEFPGMFDVAWGQDDTINGQHLTGGVVRIGGFYPLPFNKAFHLFGEVKLSLEHLSFTNSAQFVVAPGNITPTSPGVFQASVNPPVRDQYSFGVGVDLIQVVKQYVASQNKQQVSTSAPAAASPQTANSSPPTNPTKPK